MATIPDRRDIILRSAKSICSQVDELVIYVNSINMTDDPVYKKLPENCRVIFGADIGDIGKFIECEKWEGYVLTVDDDLLYPENYVEHSILKVDEYERKAVISYHGRILSTPVKSYYKAKEKYFNFANTLEKDTYVNQVGTGVMCLHASCITDVFAPFDFTMPNMSDLIFSAVMLSMGVPLVVAEHYRGWIKQLPVKWTIGGLQYDNDEVETNFVNEANWPILKLSDL